MTHQLISIQPNNLAESQTIGELANQMVACFAFADNRSRKAKNTLRRQDNDLAPPEPLPFIVLKWIWYKLTG